MDLQNLPSRSSINNQCINCRSYTRTHRNHRLFCLWKFHLLLINGIYIRTLVCSDICSIRNSFKKLQQNRYFSSQSILRTCFTDYLRYSIRHSSWFIHPTLHETKDSNHSGTLKKKTIFLRTCQNEINVNSWYLMYR